MSKSPVNATRLKGSKDSASAKRRPPVNAVYSGVSSAQRALQQQGLSRARRLLERTIPVGSEKSGPPRNYHPWQPEYSVIITREKCRKSMTKDPYNQRRSTSIAVEKEMTEEDCCPLLIPADTVQTLNLDIRSAPISQQPLIRFLRRCDTMPSERLTATPFLKSSLVASKGVQTTSETAMNVLKKNVMFALTNSPDRLLNRPKTPLDGSIIRRPPRKMLLNVSHETVMPLAVFG